MKHTCGPHRTLWPIRAQLGTWSAPTRPAHPSTRWVVRHVSAEWQTRADRESPQHSHRYTPSPSNRRNTNDKGEKVSCCAGCKKTPKQWKLRKTVKKKYKNLVLTTSFRTLIILVNFLAANLHQSTDALVVRYSTFLSWSETTNHQTNKLTWVVPDDWLFLAKKLSSDDYQRIQPGAVKLVLWRHCMHATQVHPVTAENQFHCTQAVCWLMCTVILEIFVSD